jgi:putative Ca2+/H+ antiporter (TMEM165/GDT1 family)
MPQYYYIFKVYVALIFMIDFWKTIFTTFLLVFVAELGDKTQLSTMLLASKSKSIWCVFIGSTIALAFSSLIGVFVGSAINKIIPQSYIQLCSGVIFVVFGFLLIFGKL